MKTPDVAIETLEQSVKKMSIYLVGAYAENEGPDQPAHQRRLIRAFAPR